MLNDVIFNDEISAHDDWGIILTEKDIGMPVPKTSTVDIQGSDGVLDLSNVLTNDIKFKNRAIKLTFELMNINNYTELMTEICNYLHGKVVTLSFSNDEDFYYKGRCTINQWQCSQNKGSIVVNIDAEPYKLEHEETVLTVNVNNETKEIVLPNLRKSVCPNLLVSGTINLSFNNETFTLSGGDSQLINFVLSEGSNIVKVIGSGTVRFSYRRGAL